MQPVSLVRATVLSLIFAAPAAWAEPAMMTDQEAMEALKGAAPEAVLKDATILNMGADGQMTPIKKGTNGFTCMVVPGGAMCADAAGMAWGEAWQKKAPPPQKLGFIYMLRGDNGASNTDPYATEETAGNNWIKTGPHVMIVGAEAKNMFAAYPKEAKADPTKPYVMWPGTPYEHLMLPVK